MARPTPEIATGARGPEVVDVLSRKQAAAAKARAESSPRPKSVVPLKDDEVEFHSVYGRGIYQITAPHDIVDPATGVRSAARPKKIVFDNGVFKTRDVEIIHRVKGCPGSCGKHLGADGQPAQPHTKYGLGNEFWDASEAFQRGEEKRINDAVNVAAQAIESDPAVAAQILERLGLKSFDVPARLKAEKDGKDSKKDGDEKDGDEKDGDEKE